MKIKYFQGTDTVYIELRPVAVAETRNLDENTLIELDSHGASAPSPSSMRANGPNARRFRSS